MSSPLAALGARYRFNNDLLHAVSEGFTPEDWRVRAGESNPAVWILGHVTASRRVLLRGAGQAVETAEWEALFAMGRKPSPDDPYPPADALAADFRELGERIVETLAGLTPEQAASAVPQPLPDGSRTLEGFLHFLYMHECYHLGQIGLLRRMTGKPGFI